MLSIDEDSYNKKITKAELEASYLIFSRIFKAKVPEQTSCLQSRIPQSLISSPSGNQILQQPLNDPLQRVISIDVERTRSTNYTTELKRETEHVLTFFVQKHKIEYKQGLNELAAPFMIFRVIEVPLKECYQMFEYFFWKFCLNFYLDQNFTGVEMFFRMSTVVLKYHCPSLSRYLETYDIEPQIYALSWLMTLFSSKLSLQMTHLLWQYLLIDDDKFFLFFVVVGIIIWRKDQIIESKNHSIFRIVTDMIFKIPEELYKVLKISQILRKNTPCSLTQFFRERMMFERKENFQQNGELLKQINDLNLFIVLPKELHMQQPHNLEECVYDGKCITCLQNEPLSFFSSQNPLTQNDYPQLSKLIKLSNDVKSVTGGLQFVILDLRKEKPKLKSERLQQRVFSIDIEEQFDQIESDFLNLYMEEMYSTHFVFLLSTFTIDDLTFSDKAELKYCKNLIGVLNSYSYPHLSILQGGYAAMSVYEQEFKIRKKKIKIANKPNSTDLMGYFPKTQQKEQREKFLNLTETNFTLRVDLLFNLERLRKQKRLQFFKGQDNLLAVICEYYILFLQQVQGLHSFITHLQHNCSVLPYFFSHFTQSQGRVIKVIEIESIKKLSFKATKQNTIVIKFIQKEVFETWIQGTEDQHKLNSCEIINNFVRVLLNTKDMTQECNKSKNAHSKSWKELNSGLSHHEKDKLGKQTENGKQRKVLFSLKEKENVKQMSDTILRQFNRIHLKVDSQAPSKKG